MKKLLLSAAALLALVPGFARTLSPEEALARVNSSKSQQAKAVVRSTPKLIATGDYNGMTTYYVYSSKTSAMILSASDLILPVIGTLDRPVSADTPMPEQLQWWLGKVGKAIAYYESEAPQPTIATTPTLTPVNGLKGMPLKGDIKGSYKTAAKTDIEPFIKIYWDQDSPYNALCPAGTYTGCVATATAIAMKYYNYPECGTGYVSTKYNNRTLGLTLDNKSFDWKNMLDQYTATATDAQKDAVAYLMQAVGYSVKMNYGTSSSGAQTQSIIPALVNNFKYDKGVEIYYRTFYLNEDWENLIYDELSKKRPVIYGGSGSDGGHQFICDGYRVEDGKFHFNWGWSGAYDGYYAMTSLVPDGMGAGGNSDGFTLDQDAILGVQPPVAGSVAPAAWMAVYGGKLSAKATGRNITLSAGSQGYFLNYSSRTGSFDIGYSLTDASNKTQYTAVFSNQSLMSLYGMQTLACNIASSVADGKYKLAPVYRIAGTSEWLPMKIDPYNPQYIEVTIAGSTVTCVQGPSSERPGGSAEPDNESIAENWTFGDWKTPFLPWIIGEDFEMSVEITNPTSTDGTVNLAAAVVSDEGNILSTYVPQEVSLKAGETKKVTFTGTVDDDITAGEYVCAVFDSDKMILIAGAKLDIVKPSQVEVTKMACTADPIVLGKAFTVEITAKNNGTSTESLSTTLMLCVDAAEEGYLTPKATVGTKTLAVPATGKERKYTANCTCPADLAPGKYYLALVANNNVIYQIDVTVAKDDQGVDAIIVDNEVGGTLYDLQGRPATDTPAPGLYILKNGNKTRKVIIR